MAQVAQLDHAIPIQKKRKSKKKKDQNDNEIDEGIEETQPIQKSEALRVIEEIFNPTLKIPKGDGPYTVPEAVEAGNIEALKELDEDKIIELKEAMNPLDFDAFVVLMGYKTIELDPEDVLLEAWSKWDDRGIGCVEEENCEDQLHIFPHLREPVIQDDQPEETICHENSYNFFIHSKNSSFVTTSIHKPNFYGKTNFSVDTNHIQNPLSYSSFEMYPITRKTFRIKYRQAIFSSDKILCIRLMYAGNLTKDAFSIIGKFQFIDKVLFKNDGNIMPTTYCDYQFLPHPILNEGNNWRYFHSPRYPAKYPGHIKCMYKFIGRPRNRVEIFFEEIYLLTGHNSCIRHSDKITVYDSKVPDKSSVIDVFCNEKPSRRIISTGPNLLIEFEASSNRTSNGFSAKYKFIDIFAVVTNTSKISNNITGQTLKSIVITNPVKSLTSSDMKSGIKGTETIDAQEQFNDTYKNSSISSNMLDNSKEINTITTKNSSTRLCPPGKFK